MAASVAVPESRCNATIAVAKCANYLPEAVRDKVIASSMQKARTLGFNEHLDSFTMFSRQFENYRREKIIP